MAKKWRKKILQAKVEAASGTAEVLAGSDAVLATNVEVTPLQGETASRELERPYLGAQEQIVIGAHASIAFSVELAAAGAAGSVPPWSDLLRACGFAETIAAGVSVGYSPVSDAEESATIDGVLQTLAGCRGTFNLEFAKNAIPRLRFTFIGSWVAPNDTAAAQPDYSGWQLPVIPTNANTPTFTMLGESGLAMSSLNLDMGIETTYREVINGADEVVITGRSPNGQVVVDTPPVAGNAGAELVKMAKEGTTNALRLIHGTVAGHKIQINCPKVQASQPAYQEDSGIWQTQLNWAPLPNAAAGNDEITISVL